MDGLNLGEGTFNGHIRDKILTCLVFISVSLLIIQNFTHNTRKLSLYIVAAIYQSENVVFLLI